MVSARSQTSLSSNSVFLLFLLLSRWNLKDHVSGNTTCMLVVMILYHKTIVDYATGMLVTLIFSPQSR